MCRDERVQEELNTLGWRVITIWECETHDADTLKKLVAQIKSMPMH